MQIDRISVNDLAPWIVAEMIRTKTAKTFTIIKNSRSRAKSARRAAESATTARFRPSTPDELGAFGTGHPRGALNRARRRVRADRRARAPPQSSREPNSTSLDAEARARRVRGRAAVDVDETHDRSPSMSPFSRAARESGALAGPRASAG